MNAKTTNDQIATENVALMLKQQLRMAKAAAKVYGDPIAKQEAAILSNLLKLVA
jgi:hypothetical protein